MDDTIAPASELAAMMTHNSWFDYLTIEDDAVRQAARDAADEIRGILKRNTREIGKILNEMKAHLEHGQFTDWYEAEFGMSSSTAARWMADAAAFTDEQFTTVVKLDANTRYQVAQVKDLAERDNVIDKVRTGDLSGKEEVREEVREVRAKDPKGRDQIGAGNSAVRRQRRYQERQTEASGPSRESRRDPPR